MPAQIVSEAYPIIRDKQQISPIDLTDIGANAAASLENTVKTWLGTRPMYHGMTVTEFDTTKAQVSLGWFFRNGKIYALRDVYIHDMAGDIGSTPEGQTRIIRLVAAGLEGEGTAAGGIGSQENRTFKDASKEPSNPADPWPTVSTATKTRMIRTAEIQDYVGTPGVTPEAPSIGGTVALIAEIVVSNTGIESITQALNDYAPNVDSVNLRLIDIETQMSALGPLIAGLLSSVSRIPFIEQQIANIFLELARINKRIDDLAALMNAGASTALRGYDNFVDLTQSDPAFAGYNARVDQGLRFATGTSADAKIDPTNPGASNIRIQDDKLMPSYTVVASTWSNLNTGQSQPANFQINSFAAPSVTLVRRGFGVHRTQWSKRLGETDYSSLLGQADPTPIFAIGAAGDLVYNPTTWGPWQQYGPKFDRRNGFWESFSGTGYWSRIVAGGGALSGLPGIVQPYRRTGAEDITKIETFIQKVGTTGDVRCIIFGEKNGKPDVGRVLADVTIQAVDMHPTTQTFTMPYPIHKSANEALFIGYFTTGAHKIQCYMDSNTIFGGPGKMGGRPMQWISGDWYEIANAVELSTRIFRASYNGGGGTVRVPMQNLGLGAGVDNVDIVAPVLMPEGCDLSWEVNIGGTTYPIAEVAPGGTHPLNGLPTSMGLTAVISYQDSVAPKIDMKSIANGGAYSRTSKVSAALLHVSAARLTGATIASVKEIVEVRDWDAAAQTFTAKLLSGGSYLTETDPTVSSETYTKVENGITVNFLRRTFSWTSLSIGNHRVKLIGTTSDVAKTFVGTRADWVANT